MWWRHTSYDGQLVLDSFGKYCEYLDGLGTYSRLQKYLWHLKVLRTLAKKANKTPRQTEIALRKFDQMSGVKK